MHGVLFSVEQWRRQDLRFGGAVLRVSDRAKNRTSYDVGRQKFGRSRSFGCLMPIRYDVMHRILVV